MFNCRGIFSLAVVGILTAAAPVLADSLSLITSMSAQSANDSIEWSQLGGDATSLTARFLATSAQGLSVTSVLTGSGSLTSVVCPATPCSWAGVSSGISAGDELIWTSDARNGGNGPLALTFKNKIGGGGAFVQADGPSQFTAKLEAFKGATLLGSVTESSDASGDPIYIGLKDNSGTNVSKLVFTLTACQGDCTDFAVDAVQLNDRSLSPADTVLTYDPHQLTFAAEDFADNTGAAGKPLKVEVTNPKSNANTAVLFNGSEIDDAGNDFSIDQGTTTCTDGFILNPGSHCFLGLIFQPTGLDARSGTLNILDDAHNSPQVVSLSGTGKSPGLVVSPAEIAFRTIAVGRTSAAHNVTLTNNSPVPIAFEAPTPPGDGFAIIGDTCGATLANNPGSNTCTISLTFTPADKPAVKASLEINDDAAHSPQRVELTGSGK